MKKMATTRKLKAAIFDMGGVLFQPPQHGIAKYAESLGLPKFFLESVMIKGRPNNAFCQMEIGELTASQFCAKFEGECKTAAKEQGLTLPSHFSATEMVKSFSTGKMIPEIMNAVAVLKNNGFKTSVLTNNYIMDQNGGRGEEYVHGFLLLRMFFDQFVESCRMGIRKPNPDIYLETCKRLGVQPNEAVFLDDLGPNVKAARELGMSTILVRDFNKALQELQQLTGINVFEKAGPIPCKPQQVAHCYATTKDGTKLHYAEMGQGPVLILCHGFPESWYSWRFQIPALAMAGYRVIALDQKGYGDSSSPDEIEEYTQEKLCADIISLMDVLGIGQATFIGHDWGGVVVWNLAVWYPERTRAVAGVNTPYFPPNPDGNPLKKMYEKPGVFDYQLYFQTPGVAERELERDLHRTFNLFLSSTKKEDIKPGEKVISTAGVRDRGGILVGLPEKPTLSTLLTQEDLEYYVQEYKKSGFRGPLNWYRNVETNWKWSLKAIGRKIMSPALMVTAEYDLVLPEAASRHMDKWIPNLSRAHLKCGHWTQMEQPAELNKALVEWLNKVHDQHLPNVTSML
ncbi:bifunctional epoxide hydrolase 2-like [Amphiura filiformis]|uniref:bifunctional epoxide hydrolase 2-like n=1 Tax=Amphiura filiformis TaxID=82378 RepID=UPI003B20FC1C